MGFVFTLEENEDGLDIYTVVLTYQSNVQDSELGRLYMTGSEWEWFQQAIATHKIQCVEQPEGGE
jgi:hypothetical protein